MCEFFADRLAKIDARTKKITEYPLPHRFSQPYSATVAKDHTVWITMLNSDRIAKFDPATEKFTEYVLAYARHGNSPHPGGQQHNPADRLAPLRPHQQNCAEFNSDK